MKGAKFLKVFGLLHSAQKCKNILREKSVKRVPLTVFLSPSPWQLESSHVTKCGVTTSLEDKQVIGS